MLRTQQRERTSRQDVLSAVPAEANDAWCRQELEAGQILFWADNPLVFSDSDRAFLLAQQQDDTRIHKNISYRPGTDVLRGYAGGGPADAERMQAILRGYSRSATEFLARLMPSYAGAWSLDFASFRPFQEQGRDLPLHKRNDLLHVDAFPSRPTHGGRILRFFVNLNPTEPRVWLTASRFEVLARQLAGQAGLEQWAAWRTSTRRAVGMHFNALRRKLGLRAPDYSPYDRFMLGFHDFLKEHDEFQTRWPKIQLDFPPNSAWAVFTDAVPHAALSGQFALEQTFIVPERAMFSPARSPRQVLEAICGQPLV